MYYVYALYSKGYNKIYVGYTADLNKRLENHNGLKNKGWSAKYKPWIILYSEEIDSKAYAMSREKQLKSAKGRMFLKSLIIQDSSWFSPPAGG